jgi:type II secretion system protein H
MKKEKFQNVKTAGFTMIEILIVVVILAVAAMIVVPALSSAADMQVRSAANTIAADLDYARGLAITRQKNYTVVFDPASESYAIQEYDGAANPLIKNPLTNQDFTMDIDADSRLSQVDIDSADFDGDADDAVTFNYLGAPCAGIGAVTPLNSGIITIQDKNGAFKLYVKVEAATGYVIIDNTP